MLSLFIILQNWWIKTTEKTCNVVELNALYYPHKYTLKGIFGYVGADYILRLVLRNFFQDVR